MHSPSQHISPISQHLSPHLGVQFPSSPQHKLFRIQQPQGSDWFSLGQLQSLGNGMHSSAKKHHLSEHLSLEQISCTSTQSKRQEVAADS
jgi:hypothetical protein